MRILRFARFAMNQYMSTFAMSAQRFIAAAGRGVGAMNSGGRAGRESANVNNMRNHECH